MGKIFRHRLLGIRRRARRFSGMPGHGSSRININYSALNYEREYSVTSLLPTKN